MFPPEMGGIGEISIALLPPHMVQWKMAIPGRHLGHVQFPLKHERIGGWPVSRIIKWSTSTCNKG